VTHPAFDFLSQDELDAARRSVAGMRKAADDYEFHLTVLKSFTLRMQARVAAIESNRPAIEGPVIDAEVTK
jgi:hypothetical protein